MKSNVPDQCVGGLPPPEPRPTATGAPVRARATLPGPVVPAGSPERPDGAVSADDEPDAELLVRRLVADVLVHARYASLFVARSPGIDNSLGSGNTGGGAKPTSTELPDRALDDPMFLRACHVAGVLTRVALVRDRPGVADIDALFTAGRQLEREQPDRILAVRILAAEEDRRGAAIGLLEARRRLLRHPWRPLMDRCTRAELAAELLDQAEHAPTSDTGRADLRERARLALLEPHEAEAAVAEARRTGGALRAAWTASWCPLTHTEFVRLRDAVPSVPAETVVRARARERAVVAARVWGLACGQDGAR